jgi:hypothetical protein
MHIDGYNDNFLIDAYTKRPMNMAHLPLIDATRSWCMENTTMMINGYHEKI